MDRKKENLEYGVITIISVGVFLIIAGMLTGKGLLDSTVYNSYALRQIPGDREGWILDRIIHA